MNLREIESAIQRFHQELYAFAFCLLPNEKKAEGLILEAVIVLLQKRREGEWEVDESLGDHQQLGRLKIGLYSEIYRLGKSRTLQRSERQYQKQFIPFFQLEPSSRAHLFLHQKTAFEKEDREEIMGVSRGELLSALSRSQNQLMDNAGLSWNDWI